jgi:hypothetical protein
MGVSVNTLRRRIRRGELEAVKDDRGRYLVKVEDTWPRPGGGEDAAPARGDRPADELADVAVLRERVARLEAELQARRLEIEAAQVAQREMRVLVSQAQSLHLRLLGGGSTGGLDAEIDHLLHPDDPI